MGFCQADQRLELTRISSDCTTAAANLTHFCKSKTNSIGNFLATVCQQQLQLREICYELNFKISSK